MTFEPLIFASLLGKSRRFNYFSGHVVFVSEKKSFCLSRKFHAFSASGSERLFLRRTSESHAPDL